MHCVPLAEVEVGGHLRYDRNLRSQRREKSSLLFVAFCGRLVFDFSNPAVFASYSAELAARAVAEKKKLSSVCCLNREIEGACTLSTGTS